MTLPTGDLPCAIVWQSFYRGGDGGFEIVENSSPGVALVAEYFPNPGVSTFSGTGRNSQLTFYPYLYNYL